MQEYGSLLLKAVIRNDMKYDVIKIARNFVTQ